MTILEGPYQKWRSKLARMISPNAPRVFSTPVQPGGEGLAKLATLVDAGLVKPNVDRVFDGLESAAEAMEYLQAGHARGKVVVRVRSGGL